MSTSKHIDKICCVVLAVVLVLTVLFVNAESLGVQVVAGSMGYEQKLFDTSVVHTIDIVMDDWEGFLENCTDEEYVTCSVIIDNEAYKNVAIRAKGNTSLSSVQSYGNNRYSFKIEFDHYDSSKSYYGLDKLCLNNIIQDNTYMKDYLCYQMMQDFGVDSPLCSYAYITVNGEDWGLYLAVEGVEESFLQRNYGSDYGELYKPDSTDMGGGKGNGGKFDMEEFQENFRNDAEQGRTEQDGSGQEDMKPGDSEQTDFSPDDTGEGGQPPEGEDFEVGMQGPGGEADLQSPKDENMDFDMEKFMDDEMDFGMQSPMGDEGGFGGGMSMGSDDVSLIYTDDEYSSYSNIFDNAKTDISDSDKDRLIASLKQLNEGTDVEEVVNIEEVIRYFVVHNFVCNFDSYTGSMIHNYYLYEEDGVLSMIPWDYNLAFGGFVSGTDAASLVNYPIDTPVSGGSIDSRPMLAWIFASEEYTELYHQYFAEFIAEYFESGYFESMMAEVEELIAPYVEKDPTKFCTYEEFEEGIAVLKEFCLLRAESIKGQLDGTIPSTSEGQSQNSSALIAASGISVSAMGSMGNTMGGNMPDEGNVPAGAVPDESRLPADGMAPDESVLTEDGQFRDDTLPDGSNQLGENMFPDNVEMLENTAAPDENGQEKMFDADTVKAGTLVSQNAGQNTIWILLGVSVAFLAVGLIFALRFKR